MTDRSRWSDEFGAREIVFVIGLVLVAIGCWQVYRPAAPLVVGLVLVYLALPSRGPFVWRSVPADATPRKTGR